MTSREPSGAWAPHSRKYQEPLFRFIWRYTDDEETARDLLQETLLGVSAKAVGTRVYRARKRLEDTLRAIR